VGGAFLFALLCVSRREEEKKKTKKEERDLTLDLTERYLKQLMRFRPPIVLEQQNNKIKIKDKKILNNLIFEKYLRIKRIKRANHRLTVTKNSC